MSQSSKRFSGAIAVRSAFLLFASLGMSPAMGAASVEFEAGFESVLTGLGGNVVVADFDRDGRVDLVALSGITLPVVRFYRGLGQGRFAAGESLFVSAGTVATADLNHDARPDVIVSEYEYVKVALGRGNGTFDPAVTYGPTSPNCCPRGLAIADFDGDGALDAAFGRRGAGAWILKGGGNGTFGMLLEVPLPVNIIRLAAGDLNGDGRADLISSNGSDSVFVTLGTSGPFGAAQLLRLLAPGQKLIAADLDEDGRPDLVNGASWFRGLGGGSFAPRVDFGSADAESPLVCDLNADGDLDLVATNYYELLIRLGHGDGTFGESSEWVTTSSSFNVVAADVDADGALDLVVGGGSGDFAIHRQRPGVEFGVSNQFADGASLSDVVAGDFDGDGRMDVVAVDATGVALYRGDGMGGFSFGSQADALISGPRAMVAGDFDGDGTLDVACTSFNYGTLVVLRSRGDGSFDPVTEYSFSGLPYGLATGDLDRDGRSDLVVVGYGNMSFSVYRAGPGGVLDPPVSYPVGLGSRSVGMGDLDADGWPDVLVGRTTAIEVRRGGPGGVLGPAVAYLAPTVANRIGIADFDRDGKLDLVSGGAYLFLMRGNGDGSLGVAGPLRFASSYPSRLSVADLDLDGSPEVLLTMGPSNAVGVFGVGADGSLDYGRGLGAGYYAYGVAAGEFDGDGLPDIVVTHNEGFTLLRNALPGAASVENPGRSPLSLSAPMPNPVADRITMVATLPEPARARLHLVDLAGRRVASRDLGDLPAGPHRLEWRLPASVRPGVYWVRLVQDGRSVTRRLTVIR